MRISGFHGLNSDGDVGELPPGTMTDCLNVRVDDTGILRRREGLVSLGTKPTFWYQTNGALALVTGGGTRVDAFDRVLLFDKDGNKQWVASAEEDLGYGTPAWVINAWVPDPSSGYGAGSAYFNSGSINGWVRYCYTLYDPVNDVESQPSACSDAVYATMIGGTNIQVYITGLDEADDLGVYTHIRIYRTRVNTDGYFQQSGGTGDSFLQTYSKQYWRVTTVALGGQTIRTITAEEVVLGRTEPAGYPFTGWINNYVGSSLPATVNPCAGGALVGTYVVDDASDDELDMPLAMGIARTPDADYAVVDGDTILVAGVAAPAAGEFDERRRVWWVRADKPEMCLYRHTAPEPSPDGSDAEARWRRPSREAFVDVAGGGTGPITGLASVGGRVAVYFADGVAFLQRGGGGYAEAAGGRGLASVTKRMMVSTPTALCWLDDTGVWRLDGEGLRCLSRGRIDAWLGDIDWSLNQYFNGAYNPKRHEVWWLVNQSATGATLYALVLNLRRSEFYVYKFGGGIIASATVGDDLVLSGTALQYRSEANSSGLDNGVDFDHFAEFYLRKTDGGDARVGVYNVFREVLPFVQTCSDSNQLNVRICGRRDTTVANDKEFVLTLADSGKKFLVNAAGEFLRTRFEYAAGDDAVPAFELARIDAEVR